MRALLSTLLILIAVSPCRADDPDRLFVRPWTELEPLVRIGPGPYPIPASEAKKNVLELGRVLVSGMVYGWNFTYIPGDKARRVEESFQLAPIAQVQWGNPRLQVTETEVTDTRLWARVAYSLDQDESHRRAAWESNIAAESTGQGIGALQLGDEGRTKSLEAAIRDAIRRGLDTRYLNKPREITGELVLWTDPVVITRSGSFLTTATIKLLVRDIVPYRIF
jgi:hypothetical protein